MGALYFTADGASNDNSIGDLPNLPVPISYPQYGGFTLLPLEGPNYTQQVQPLLSPVIRLSAVLIVVVVGFASKVHRCIALMCVSVSGLCCKTASSGMHTHCFFLFYYAGMCRHVLPSIAAEVVRKLLHASWSCNSCEHADCGSSECRHHRHQQGVRLHVLQHPSCKCLHAQCSAE